MRKNYFLPIICFILILSSGYLLNGCKKDSKNIPETSEETIATKKPSPSPNIYEGPCPYECDDNRCRNYEDYCGEETPVVSITSIQSEAITNQMITSFQSLQVNFSQLSSELGLSYTLSANDIDFQNLSRSYITNDDGVGEAIVAPFTSNSTNNSTNYAFAVTVDASHVYKPYIIKTTTNQSLKYFDLDEGYILTVNNYNNSSTLSFQNSLGSYITGSPNTVSRSAGCGQATMDCIIDAYSNHGWLSVWVSVQSIYIPHTGLAIAGACAIKNCIPRSIR